MQRFAPLLLLLLPVACASSPDGSLVDPKGVQRGPSKDLATSHPEEANAPRDLEPLPPAPWTEAFQKKSVLLAYDIVVEGPEGLVVHAKLTSDLTRYVVENKTTEQGFEQRAVARPEVGREVRCNLDQWTLAAENSILVLERPVPCDVVIRATGNAVFRDVDGNEQRQNELEFVGKLSE